MVGVVDLVGIDVVLELFKKTQQVEADGGMMIKNGARRRTPGGVFLHLLREINNDERVDPIKVKQFFAQSQKNDFYPEHKRHFQHQKGRQGFNRAGKNHPYKGAGGHHRQRYFSGEGQDEPDNFQNELEALKKLSQKVKDKKEKRKQNQRLNQPEDMEQEEGREIKEEEEETIRPLPDILTSISRRIADSNVTINRDELPLHQDARGLIQNAMSSTQQNLPENDLLASCQPSTSTRMVAGGTATTHHNASQLDTFIEPEAPPNSVERVERNISTYEDDLLSEFNTEDIELF